MTCNEVSYCCSLHADEELAAGKDEFIKYGNLSLKNKVEINPNNFFERLLHFFTYRYHGGLLGVDIVDIVRCMMRTGFFYPSARWVTPFAGRGMDFQRADACFKMLMNPDAITNTDVRRVFFDPSSFRYFCAAATSHVQLRHRRNKRMRSGCSFLGLEVSSTTGSVQRAATTSFDNAD